LNYVTLQPRYRLADQVPNRQQAVQASHRIDTKLAGANPIDTLIEFPAGTSLYASQTLDVIAEVHKIMENQAGIGNVWSLETLRRWLSDKADIHDASVLKEYVTALPGFLVRRFIAEHQDAVVVSSRIPDSDANQLLPVIEGLDKRLNELRASHPGYTIAVTGLAAVAARSRSTNSAPG
jgi:uncharacterized protein